LHPVKIRFIWLTQGGISDAEPISCAGIKTSHIRLLAQSGFGLFAAAFLFNGFNILITAYFKALGNAKISAATIRYL